MLVCFFLSKGVWGFLNELIEKKKRKASPV
jgi:hypothetical protein